MSQNNPTAEPITKPRKHAQQSKAMGDYITESGVLLATALTDTGIANKLTPRSYTPAKIGAGVALQNAAQIAYNGRQGNLGNREVEVSQQKQMFEEERAEFDAFRTLARPMFPDKGDRTTLNLSGTVPTDMQEFVTFARVGYTNAQNGKYQAELQYVGYDASQLEEELDELTQFEAQMSGRQVAGGGAQTSTNDRNTAFRALKAWMDRFEGVCKVALGPDIYKMPFDELPNVSVPKTPPV